MIQHKLLTNTFLEMESIGKMEESCNEDHSELFTHDHGEGDLIEKFLGTYPGIVSRYATDECIYCLVMELKMFWQSMSRLMMDPYERVEMFFEESTYNLVKSLIEDLFELWNHFG